VKPARQRLEAMDLFERVEYRPAAGPQSRVQSELLRREISNARILEVGQRGGELIKGSNGRIDFCGERGMRRVHPALEIIGHEGHSADCSAVVPA
jgi:hypothetical protein